MAVREAHPLLGQFVDVGSLNLTTEALQIGPTGVVQKYQQEVRFVGSTRRAGCEGRKCDDDNNEYQSVHRELSELVVICISITS